MKDIIGSCPLCGERALHVAGTEEAQVMQCINCGYTTSTKFKGIKADNEEFQKLGEDMKNWAKEENGHIWIPSIITLPIGMLYPVNIKKQMKWAFAPMVEIPEKERENFPNPQGGFYDKKVDTDNSTLYDLFIEGMTDINEILKQRDLSGSK
jgi:ribosomal protein L37E